MKFIKYSVAVVVGFFLFAGSILAQGQQMQQAQPDSITDEELTNFAKVAKELPKINQEITKEAQNLLSDKEMDMQRFQQIMMSKRNPNSDSLNVTKKEQKTLNEIQPKLMRMQQQKVMGAMQENDLNPRRFQTIRRAVQTDTTVAKRFQKIARDTMKQ